MKMLPLQDSRWDSQKSRHLVLEEKREENQTSSTKQGFFVLLMTAENSWHLLQQAKEERVEPVLALPQLWQLSDPNLKVEEDLRLWTLKKEEAEKPKDTGGRLNRGAC